MSRICQHNMIWGRCPECDADPPRLNLDRHGLPRDYATYVWLLYKRVVEDESPARRAFLHGSGPGFPHPNFGQQIACR